MSKRKCKSKYVITGRLCDHIFYLSPLLLLCGSCHLSDTDVAFKQSRWAVISLIVEGTVLCFNPLVLGCWGLCVLCCASIGSHYNANQWGDAFPLNCTNTHLCVSCVLFVCCGTKPQREVRKVLLSFICECLCHGSHFVSLTAPDRTEAKYKISKSSFIVPCKPHYGRL